MNDRYLFKAKGESTEKWYIGLLTRVDGDICWIKTKDGEYVCKTSTICQCTGLKDKHKNLIWENDVVKTYNSLGQECFIEHIVWADYGLNVGWCSKGIKSLIKNGNRVYDTGFSKSDAINCEVIENIFDNPELLEVE